MAQEVGTPERQQEPRLEQTEENCPGTYDQGAFMAALSRECIRVIPKLS